jgi:hypothetical protein
MVSIVTWEIGFGGRPARPAFTGTAKCRQALRFGRQGREIFASLRSGFVEIENKMSIKGAEHRNIPPSIQHIETIFSHITCCTLFITSSFTIEHLLLPMILHNSKLDCFLCKIKNQK